MIVNTYGSHFGELTEDQWLMKLRPETEWDDEESTSIQSSEKTAFLTKLTQKGEIPKKFLDWGRTYYNGKKIPCNVIYVFQESFRTGWRLIDFRIGKSQQWAIIKNPEGFRIEIYLSDLKNHILNDTLNNGVLMGSYKWVDNKLIRKD